MEGRKRQIPDDNSEAANKEPTYGRRRIAHEASFSRRPESALSKDERAACRDQQRQRGPRYEEQRYSAETEHDKQHNDEYHRPRAVWQDTRRHAESANRNPNYYNNHRGRPHQQGFRGRRDSNENASNQPVPQPPSPGQSSPMGPPPSVIPTAGENQPEQRSQIKIKGPTSSVIPTAGENQPEQRSQIKIKDPVPAVDSTAGGSQAVQRSPNEREIDSKFRKVMRESPWLYDRNHVDYKDVALVDQSWKDVSSACGITVVQCKDKLEQVKSKYRRQQRLLADRGSLPDQHMQFIEDWKFLRYQRRTTTQNTTPTVSSTANQTQSSSAPRGVVRRRLSSSNSGIRTNKPMLDQSFADDLAEAMQDFSARQKYKFKYKCLKLAKDIPRHPNA